jgi:beta-glucosidase
VLPIAPGSVRSIAVIGRLAIEGNMGDHGSSRVDAPGQVTPVDGLRAAYPDAEIVLVTEDSPEQAAAAAAAADVAIIVTGYGWEDEGEFIGGSQMRTDPVLLALYPPLPEGMEDALNTVAESGTSDRIMMNVKGGDRASLALRQVDQDIITAVAAANPRTVVAIVSAGAVLTDPWRGNVPAMLMMWYAGMEGGHALADIVSGASNPSGRLPYALPQSADDLPFFDREATAITYDRLHGQRLLDARGATAAFPHGFGLSYTDFQLSDARITHVQGNVLSIAVTVANAGSRAGHHVVQVYGRRHAEPYRGQTMLLGFTTVYLRPAASGVVTVGCSLRPLSPWDERVGDHVAPDLADVTIVVGGYAHHPDATTLSPQP